MGIFLPENKSGRSDAVDPRVHAVFFLGSFKYGIRLGSSLEILVQAASFRECLYSLLGHR